MKIISQFSQSVGNFFTSLFTSDNSKNKRKKNSFYDTPHVPYGDGSAPQDIVEKSFNSYNLMPLLNKYRPELCHQYEYSVLTASSQSRAEQAELEQLKAKKEPVEEEYATARASIEELFDTQKPDFDPKKLEKPEEPWWHWLLTAGLSIMLFLGFCHYLDVDIADIPSLNFYNPAELFPLLQALFGAICINLGEKIGIEGLAESHCRYEPKRNHRDDSNFKNNLPWWELYRTGDVLIWSATLFVIVEVCFAVPGLLSLQDPTSAAQLSTKIILACGAALAALANIYMAVQTAKKQIEWKQKRCELFEREQEWLAVERERLKSDDSVRENRHHQTRAAKAKRKLESIEQEIAVQKAIADDAFERARREHERWEFEVKRWIEANPEKVEQHIWNYSFKDKVSIPELRSGDRYTANGSTDNRHA